MKRLLVVGAVGLIAACSSGQELSATVISTFNTVGPGSQRVLVEIVDADGRPVALESAPTATLRDENGSPLTSATGVEVWLVPDEEVAYAFQLDIPQPETYQLTIETSDVELSPAGFVAVADPQQVEPGETAPPIGGDEVVGPTAVVFASTAWCPSNSCQPMIDQVSAAAGAADIDFVHAEVFANPEVGTESELELSDDVATWGIPSQPWLFVIDTVGRVSSMFEGGVSAEELSEAFGEAS